MKYLYVDVKKRKLVGVFQLQDGNILYLNKEQIEVQKQKHQMLSSFSTIKQCDEALEAMGEYKQKHVRWWQFWKFNFP